MDKVKRFTPHIYVLVTCAVFLDSLRFKFTNHPNTQTIFGKLDAWAATFGAQGIFNQTGLFSQYTIGTVELFASILMLVGFMPALRRLQTLGILAGVLVLTGAVYFHLFTPLGIDPNNDGGGLFIMAASIWGFGLLILFSRRKQLLSIGCIVQTLYRPH